MTTKKSGVAILGCGNIADKYAKKLVTYSEVELLGVSDIDPARTQAFAEQFGVRAYASFDELLADPRVEIVVNLTIHHAHFETTSRILNAGKHVHTEKPLALTSEEAHGLVDLAAARGLRLSSAPITFMGEAQQTVWKLIRENRVGKVRAVFADVNWGRIETWHPNPAPFYDVGPMFDVGVYPLTLATTFFGPARRLIAYGTTLKADRVTKDGTPFRVDTPDFLVAVIDHADGTVTRLTADFYIHHHNTKQSGLEFHGDNGSIYLQSMQDFAGAVEMSAFAEPLAAVAPVREVAQGTEFARGVQELAQAIQENRPQRATGAQAAHVVDILCAVEESRKTGRSVEITSEFPAPWPMDWAGERMRDEL